MIKLGTDPFTSHLHDPFIHVAESCRLPVFQLSGGIDPIVPWWQVRPGLRQHCPGYRASRIIARAGHNILMSASHESARQILEWIGAAA